jgi:hypothetical protein
MEITFGLGEKTTKIRPSISVYTLRTTNSTFSVVFYVRISGIRPNPLKYTDPDGKDIVRLSKDDIKVSKWHTLNIHLNTYIELKNGVQKQIRKNEIKIDLLKGEITKMRIDLMYQSFQDTLDIVNTFGNSVIGAVKGYSQGYVLGALTGALDNLDAQSVSEFYIDMKSEGRLQSIDFEILKVQNKTEINRLISENKGLVALQQSYQNEINEIAREMERELNE